MPEDLGSVSVSIRGDYSQLGSDFDAAVQVAIQRAAAMAAAINTTMQTAFSQQSPVAALQAAIDQLSANFAKLGASAQQAGAAINSAMAPVGAAASQASASIAGIGPAAATAGAEVEAALGPSGQAGRSVVGTGILVRALGQEMGVGIPRAVSSVLASMGPVASVIQAAFIPIVAVAFIEILGKVAAKVGEVIDALGGWDAKTQATYASITAQNEQLYQSYEHVREAIDNIATIGKSGAEKYIAEEGNVEKAIKRVNQEINNQRAALAEAQKLSAAHIPLWDVGNVKNAEEAFKSIPGIEANIQRLTIALRDLSQVKGPTVAAEATAALAKEIEKVDAAFKSLNFGDVTGGMNRFQLAAAEALATFRDQRSAIQEDVDWLAKYHSGLLGVTGAITEMPPVLDETSKSITKLSDPNVLQFFKQLSNEMNEAALGPARQLNQAFRDFNLKDPDAQVQKFVADLRILGSLAEQGAIDADTYQKAWVKTFQAAEAAGIQFSAKLETQMAAVEFSLKAAQDQAKLFGNVLRTASQDIASGLTGIITGAETMRQAVGNALRNIADMMISVVVEQGIAAILKAFGLTTLGAMQSAIAQIQDAAAVAYANAYAAYVGIPFVGPALAEAAGAAAYSTTIAAEGLVHFDTGGWVPEDMIAQVHKGEYVVPAAEASHYVSGNLGNSPVTINAYFNGHPRENAREFAKLLKVSAPQFTF